jgi:hypothetical protein
VGAGAAAVSDAAERDAVRSEGARPQADAAVCGAGRWNEPLYGVGADELSAADLCQREQHRVCGSGGDGSTYSFSWGISADGSAWANAFLFGSPPELSANGIKDALGVNGLDGLKIYWSSAWSTKSVLKAFQCGSKIANQLSIAGVLGLTKENEEDGFATKVGKTVGTAFLGNTFSGLFDAGTHIATGHFGAAYADAALGGTTQGLTPGMKLPPSAGGIVGNATDFAVNFATAPGSVLSAVTGESTLLAAEGTAAAEGLAGPIGWVKLGYDLLTFGGSTLYCYNHQ